MKYRMKKIVSFFVLAFFLLSLSSVGISAAPSKTEKEALAPDFKLESLGGKTLQLKDLRGEKVVLLFFATWCPYCQKKIRAISREKDMYEKNNVKILLIDVGESARQVSSFVSKYKIPFDVLLDMDSKVAMAYDVVGVPTFIFVSPKGQILKEDNDMSSNYESIFQ